MITFTHTGDFSLTSNFLMRLKRQEMFRVLDRYGQLGVEALAANTPVNSGTTAASWGYEIHQSNGSVEIVWTNSNINEGIPIAVLIQYGHGLNNGGYVQGVDFVNPAMQPIFDEIAESVWREVTKL